MLVVEFAQVLLLLPGLLEFLLKLLLELLDMPATLFALHAQHMHFLVILATSRRIAYISEHSGILLEIPRVLEVFKLLGWLNTILCAHLFILILLVRLLSLPFLNRISQFTAFFNQIHVVAHDQNMISFVNLPFDLESFFQRVHGVLQELALILILLLNVGIYVSMLGLLVFDKVEETLVNRNL